MIVGVVGVLILFALVAIGVPISLALFVTGFAGVWYLKNFSIANSVAELVPLEALDGDVAALPLFMLIGSFAMASGVATDGYKVARNWLGRLPGGLGLTTLAAASAFAACSGSSVASAVAMGKLSIPEMKRVGYKDSLIAGVIGAGGLLAIMIPPSGLLVLYGLITGESISKLIMAAIIPGILLGLAFMCGVYLKAKMDPSSAPLVYNKVSWKERFRSLGLLWGIFIIFGTIFIGLFTGLFTATESAAFGALAALIMLYLRGRKVGFGKKFIDACVESAQLNITIYFLILSAYAFTHFLVLAGLPQAVQATVGSLDVSPMMVLTIVIITYLILGMFLESTTIILITVPIYYPIVTALGFDGIWFGIILACMIEIGLLTPPFGLVAFTIKAITPEFQIHRIFKGTLYFVLIQLIVVVLIIFIPEIVLWLPGTMGDPR